MLTHRIIKILEIPEAGKECLRYLINLLCSNTMNLKHLVNSQRNLTVSIIYCLVNFFVGLIKHCSIDYGL